jgi:hypothetical protein
MADKIMTRVFQFCSVWDINQLRSNFFDTAFTSVLTNMPTP